MSVVSEALRIRCDYEPCHADEETEGQSDTLLCPLMRARALCDLAASTPSQPPVGGPLCPWAESVLSGTTLPHQALGGLSRCCGRVRLWDQAGHFLRYHHILSGDSHTREGSPRPSTIDHQIEEETLAQVARLGLAAPLPSRRGWSWLP